MNERQTDNEYGYPGRYELRLDRKTNTVENIFIPDESYICYVENGGVQGKPGAVYIDAVDDNIHRCIGTYYGYRNNPDRNRNEPTMTLYPHRKNGGGMHPSLWMKRNIPLYRVVSRSYYDDKHDYGYYY